MKPINLKRNLLFHRTDSQGKLIGFARDIRIGDVNASIVQGLHCIYDKYILAGTSVLLFYFGLSSYEE